MTRMQTMMQRSGSRYMGNNNGNQQYIEQITKLKFRIEELEMMLGINEDDKEKSDSFKND